ASRHSPRATPMTGRLWEPGRAEPEANRPKTARREDSTTGLRERRAGPALPPRVPVPAVQAVQAQRGPAVRPMRAPELKARGRPMRGLAARVATAVEVSPRPERPARVSMPAWANPTLARPQARSDQRTAWTVVRAVRPIPGPVPRERSTMVREPEHRAWVRPAPPAYPRCPGL